MKYDGRANVYIATIGTKKTALKPLVISATHAKDNLLLTEKQIASELEKEVTCYSK